jgi:hypothetical protein
MIRARASAASEWGPEADLLPAATSGKANTRNPLSAPKPGLIRPIECLTPRHSNYQTSPSETVMP